MLRSMYSGISGMKNFQTKLDVIGNNIANVNTYGFKKGRVTFKDTMNQTVSGASGATAGKGGKNPMQVGLGSTLASIDIVDTQSSLQTTGRSLDLAIDGDGYFIVKNGNSNLYTRAGNFYLDNTGTLVNSDGLKVQQFDSTGNLKDIVVDVNSIFPSQLTDDIKVVGNLPKSVSGTTEQTQQIEVVDGNGVKHVLELKTSSSDGTSWKFTFEDKSLDAPPANTPDANKVSINLTYDATNNKWTQNGTNIKLKLNDGTGKYTETGNINLDLSKLTYGGENLNAVFTPNGQEQGSLESFNIGSMGEVNGVYSNGKVIELGVLALAKFSNPAGLQKAGNNTFQATVNSGTANYGNPGNGLGTLASGSLEMSNVDLSEEFTEMIVAQRGFQANTRIITTSDEILQELINLKR
ncbi:flagellar hook protein FlgE [Heyndrickxia vini]|uniref:Flagellar hook protein FlgE n=1 Tax=Heyndrickxia vini TaxID=1476025 RepID=A0ABX7DWR9_9BACI|nr:flagellar hook-basal body complex protein [Heyndrickxia vini]QQZ07943.1 flagellar hook-basal body complex protein [Heyndrickxia vini]